ncbi:MAG: carboxymuconolactone decarboxylase family protein [Microlunatus sp.]|nr:carboxymuconolactone decarboxylase family protein [Microlunatus sp.]
MEPRMDLLQNETGGKIAKRLFAINQLVEASTVPKNLRELVNLRPSQINGCAPCVDIHTKEAAAAGESQLRLNLVAVWRETGLFSDAERAALALAEEGTRIADAFQGVSDQTWAEVRKHFDDDQIAVLVAEVALINAANRMNVILRNQGGTYDRSMLAALAG